MALEEGRLNVPESPTKVEPLGSVKVEPQKGPSTGASMALPLVFNEVNYSVKDKDILKNISGFANTGELLALMGPTGSGKTTLLNALAHRIDITSGKVSYGPYRWSKALKQHVGVVEQDDIVFPELTVKQSLTFTARLRLPRTMTKNEKLARVQEVIEQLRLQNCQDTRIGDSNERGVSGGERKRLCIASEFITRPRIILFDEPTSGLDSTMAQMVVENMRTIAQQGVVVVSSIHQPSSQVFGCFDRLLLLDSGEVAYFGTVKNCLAPFEAFGLKCPDMYNGADFLMDVIVLEKLSVEDRKTLIARNAQVYPQPEKLIELRDAKHDRYPTSWFEQVRILSRRTLISTKSEFLGVRIALLYLGISAIAGLLWFNLGLTEEEIFPRTSLSLWIVGTWMFFPMLGTFSFFPDRMVSLRKEIYVNSYRLSAFFVAETTIALLPLYFWGIIWMTLTYLFAFVAVGSFEQLLLMLLEIVLEITAFHGIGLAISAAIREEDVITVMMLLFTYLFGYSGLFVPIDQLPQWIGWTTYANVLVFSYQLMMVIVFQFPGEPYSCAVDGQSLFDVCEQNGTSFIEPDELLLGINVIIPPWLSITVLLAVAVICRVIAYRCLRWDISKTKR